MSYSKARQVFEEYLQEYPLVSNYITVIQSNLESVHSFKWTAKLPFNQNGFLLMESKEIISLSNHGEVCL